ncbi:MAG: phosphate ABC transporter permease PstA [Phycisphaeraceae bacterium]|nr:phosphate ABC transporter permease PstA [Phycisphaeraceae bacterium]
MPEMPPALRRQAPSEPSPRRRRGRQVRPGTALLARGEPLVWLTGGALALCLAMILCLLALIFAGGLRTFWPQTVERVVLGDGTVMMGEISRQESDPTGEAGAVRTLLRTGNFDVSGKHFQWMRESDVRERDFPRWAMVAERLSWGRFFGVPVAFIVDGQETVSARGLSGEEAERATAKIWALYREHHPSVVTLRSQRVRIETHDVGEVNAEMEEARLAARQAELDYGKDSPRHGQAAEVEARVRERTDAQFAELQKKIADLRQRAGRYQIVLASAQGQEKSIELAEIVRLYPANQLDVWGKLRLYGGRWWEFLSDVPREANSEGGVFPAIFGTVLMTLIMSVAVVPLGVLAALYLREYAKAGALVNAIRIAINNLAGVPSIVFGVFGLVFFCYSIGSSIDEVLFEARLPSPTYGTGGILWAALTLALLTLPVVIIATEEALSAVPRSMREGSYACGASKWQTVRRIVLPRAMPGIMTGAILAMARGAGEVAPLMLVGAVKLAPQLPMDGQFPFLHPQRSFMHLGFHIYDLGFQSQNSEAAKPMVFTTTLLLIVIIAVLNVTAMALRTRLKKRFVGGQF